MTFGADGRILDFNPASETIFGYRADETVGAKHIVDLLAPESRLACRLHVAQAISDPASMTGWLVETTAQHATGRRFPLEVSLSRWFEPTGEVRLTITVRDISERIATRARLNAKREALARLNDALAEANTSLERTVEARTADLRHALERAETANRLRDAIFANMTHEFRTPLAAILGSASILEMEVPAPLHEFVGAITSSGQRLLLLLDGVLHLATLQAGSVVAHPVPGCLATTLQGCADEVRPRAEAKGVAFEVDIPPPPVPFVFDAALVGRTLQPLLDNAVKFTDPGGRITLRLRTTPEAAIVEVEDTGIGMDAAFLARAFDPFEQASTGLSRTHEGAGVGLPVAHGMAQVMGADLALESTPGTGTVARLTLPRPAPAT